MWCVCRRRRVRGGVRDGDFFLTLTDGFARLNTA
jgi:hypothetical protein